MKIHLIALSALVLFTQWLLHMPVAAVPGYEFAMGLNAFCVPLFGLLTIFTPNLSTRRLCGMQLLLLLVPFCLASLNALRVGGCGFVQGAAFFVLLPVVGATLSSAVAWRLRQLVSRRGIAAMIFIGILCASLIWTLLCTVASPALFAFNPFFGFFPGPIYDPALMIETRLITHRLYTLAIAVVVLLAPWPIWRSGVAYWRSRRGYITVVALLLVISGYLMASSLGWVTSRRQLQRELSVSLPGKGFTLRYTPQLQQAGFDAEAMQQDIAYWLSKIDSELSFLSRPRPITVYVYSDAQQKRRLTGAGRTLIGNPLHGEVHMLPGRFPDTTLLHELVHVAAAPAGLPFLGLGRTPAIMEGLAVALERWEAEWPLHLWAKAILEDPQNRIAPLQVLSGWGFFAVAPQKSYLLAGSFMRYLLDTYGVSSFLMLYRTGDYTAVYGSDLPQLIHAWRQELSKLQLDEKTRQQMFPNLRRRGFFEEQCPRQSAWWRERGYSFMQQQAWQEAATCLQRSYQLSGGSPADGVAMLQLNNLQPKPLADAEVQDLANSLIAAQQSLATAHLSLALSHLRTGKSLEAFPDLYKVLQLAPQPEVWLAVRLLELGRPQEVLQLFNAAAGSARRLLLQQWQSQASMPQRELRLVTALWDLEKWGGDPQRATTKLEQDLVWLERFDERGLPLALRRRTMLAMISCHFRRRDELAAQRLLSADQAAVGGVEAQLWKERLKALKAADSVDAAGHAAKSGFVAPAP